MDFFKSCKWTMWKQALWEASLNYWGYGAKAKAVLQKCVWQSVPDSWGWRNHGSDSVWHMWPSRINIFSSNSVICCLNPQGQNKAPWLTSESTVTALFIFDNMWFLLLSKGKYTENSDTTSFQDRKCHSRHSWGDGSSHVGPGDISLPLSSS